MTVVTDDYLLDDLERSQLNATRRRRWNRSRRYYRMLLLTAGLVALLVLAAPSIISHTGIARSMLASSASTYGWDASAESIDVGWITPLSIRGLQLTGRSGDTDIQIERADTALTITNLINFDPEHLGEVSLRGVTLACTVNEGYSSIEADLADLLQPSEESQSPIHSNLQIQDVAATVTDVVTGASWMLNQSNVDVTIEGQDIHGEIAGVVNEPGGSGGAIQSQFAWHPNDSSPVAPAEATEVASRWQLAIETDSFPLSVTNLIARRFAGQMQGLPQQFSGDTTGRLQLVGSNDGAMTADLGDVRIRNLKAIRFSRPGDSPGSSDTDSNATGGDVDITQWHNALATLNGKVALTGGWLVGQGLVVATDFASATIDGSFPTQISLVGEDDNPLSWLQALEGKARVDVDLAMLDQALPGLIPLRRDVTLVSGRAIGVIENTPASGSSPDATTGRRSVLAVSSDALRARADGRVVVVDPIELSATVTDDQGSLRAERFQLTSSFAEASGRGTLRDGKADVQVDFGRLYAMLRPVVDLSELSLGGTAKGEIEWNVQRSGDSDADQWDLRGNGEAKNLLVTLPSGYRFKRNLVQGDVSAQGRWNGRSLQQLSNAAVAIRSGGVSLGATLLSPVAQPTLDSIYAVRLESDGRLENLNESLRPWLPESLRTAEGRLTGSAIAKVSRLGGSVTKADFVVSQPRINFDNRWYTQPSVTVKFDGVLDWPSGNFSSQECTIEGDAMTLAVRGEMSREKTHLDIAWNADLKRVQESIGSTIARAASTKLVRPISFRPVQVNSHRITGLCKGRLNLQGGPAQWRIDSTVTGTDLALYQPARGGNVPPGTISETFGSQSRATFGQSFGRAGRDEFGDLMWQEPTLKLDGMIEYDHENGVVTLPEIQVASDGFVSTLQGEIRTTDDAYSVSLSGPSRWKMDVIANRLATLTGTPMRATGVSDGPIEMQWQSSPTGLGELQMKGRWGWEQFEVGGVRLGKTSLPLAITEQAVTMPKTVIPILSLSAEATPNANQAVGQATVAATLDYGVSPMTLRIERGSTIDTLQITPDTASGWLQYLTPLAARATSLDGRIAAEFQEAIIVVDDPTASVVRGSLDVQQLRLSSGPLASQLIRGVEQIKSLARLAGGAVEPASAKTLIEMPPQSVEFSLENGIVTHQRMYFKIDRANLMTSGRVGIDSSINLVAHVPLDARWLGSDLQGLAGQTLTFPITGTLSNPRLDDSIVRNVMSDLGSKAGAEVIQNQLNGLLQKQFGSGMDQLNSGLEKIFPF